MLALVLACAVLSGFCYVYAFTPIGIEDPSHATLVKTMPGGLYSNMTEGFAWNRADANGYYNASAELAEDPEVLLIGSSHVEALQVPMEDSIGGLLNQEYRTYNIAVSGHVFHISANHLLASVPYYQPSRYVVMEAFGLPVSLDILKSVAEAEEVSVRTPPIYERMRPPLKQIYRGIRTVFPAILTMYQGLNLWKSTGSRSVSSPSEQILYSEEYMKTLDQVIGKAQSIVSQQGARLIIFVHDGGAIDENGCYYVDAESQKAFDAFETVCRDNDVVFIDMNDTFRKFYEQERILPHGFVNTAVGYGHLNRYGHKLIADRLLAAMREMEE